MIARLAPLLRNTAVRAAVGLAVLSALGHVQVATADKPARTVELVVDYGDGAQLRYTGVPWSEAMTVLDALAAAEKHPHGVTFARRGSGTQTLVTAIGDVENEGRGRNWLFSVNGKLSNTGAGARQLAPGDAVLWEFKEYE